MQSNLLIGKWLCLHFYFIALRSWSWDILQQIKSSSKGVYLLKVALLVEGRIGARYLGRKQLKPILVPGIGNQNADDIKAVNSKEKPVHVISSSTVIEGARSFMMSCERAVYPGWSSPSQPPNWKNPYFPGRQLRSALNREPLKSKNCCDKVFLMENVLKALKGLIYELSFPNRITCSFPVARTSFLSNLPLKQNWYILALDCLSTTIYRIVAS